MNKLTDEQFREYAADPLATDAKVRQWCDLPEDRYYTVAVWPHARAGQVRVTTGLHRVVRAQKVSKSDQSQPQANYTDAPALPAVEPGIGTEHAAAPWQCTLPKEEEVRLKNS